MSSIQEYVLTELKKTQAEIQGLYSVLGGGRNGHNNVAAANALVRAREKETILLKAIASALSQSETQ